MADERVIPQLNTADEYIELFKLIKAFRYVQDNAERLAVGSFKGTGEDRVREISNTDLITFIADNYTDIKVSRGAGETSVYTSAPSSEELVRAMHNALKITGKSSVSCFKK